MGISNRTHDTRFCWENIFRCSRFPLDISPSEFLDKLHENEKIYTTVLDDKAPGETVTDRNYPDSKIHGANTGPIWGRQDPVGPHVGPMNFAIWDIYGPTATAQSMVGSWRLILLFHDPSYENFTLPICSWRWHGLWKYLKVKSKMGECTVQYISNMPYMIL